MVRVANYGVRLKVGLMLPSPNAVAEQQMAAMLPDGVSFQTTRLKLAGGTREELFAMTEEVERAAELLSHARVDLIAFHCTAASTLEPGLIDGIKARIEAVSGRGATTTGHAARAALDALKAKKIVFLCPNRRETHEREVAFFRNSGYEVVRDQCLGVVDPALFETIAPRDFQTLATENRADEADAYFIGCTAVRSAEPIEAIEAELGRPVVTSNQAMVWHALRSSGIDDRVQGYGALLRDH